MAGSEDIERVLVAVRDGLERLGVPLQHCGVNLVDTRVDPPSVRFHNMALTGYWTFAEPEDSGTKALLRFWRDQQVVYRKDLELEDLYGEKGNIRRDHGAATRSVVDVPFPQGTLAMNSTEPEAFSGEDIEILQEMAQVLSEGFQRSEDLQTLEQRNRELEHELAERNQAEGMLRESEEKFRQLVENIDVVFWITDPERTRNLYLSPSHEKVWGHSCQSAYENPTRWREDLHPEDRDRVLAGLEGAASGGYDESYRIVRPDDGSVRWLRTRSFPIRDESGKVYRIAGITTDITQIKFQEGQKDILHQVREEVWKLGGDRDVENLMQAIRKGVERMGIPFSNCEISQVDTSVSPPEVRCHRVPDTEGQKEKCLMADKEVERILRFWKEGEVVYRPDIEAVDVYAEGKRFQRGNGRPVRAVIDVPFSHGILEINSARPNTFSEQHITFLQELAEVLSEGFRRLEDLRTLETERQQIEENLKLSLALQQVRNEILQVEKQEHWEKVALVCRRELDSLVSFAECSIVLVDLQQGTGRAYYCPVPGEVRVSSYASIHPLLTSTVERGVLTYRRTRAEIDRGEERIHTRINSVIDIPFASGTLAINSTEENAFRDRDVHIMEHFAQVLSEAHRRLQDLQALEEKDLQLRQAQKLEAIGQLAGGVAHDFNNLLTIVSGYSEVLERRFDSQDSRCEYLQEIQNATDRGATLVRQLLAFSRRQVLQPEVLNLNVVISDLGKMLRRLIGEHIELHLSLDPGLELVKGDRGQLEQVLMNLVVNARDAMLQGGQLRIETRNARLEPGHIRQQVFVQSGSYTLLMVSDTGVGMDRKVQERIFEPFFTTKEMGKGTGLGLATVYGIVKQSGGYIWVDSEVNKGTTFEVYLPCVAEEAQETGSRKEVGKAALRGAETVLIVEDEEALRRLLALGLREQGYAVLEAGRGDKALQMEIQSASPIHLLVTDIVMPGMNGRQLAEQLRARQPEMKVLYMSGYTEGIIEQHSALEAGAALLQKPFSPETLALKIREVLDSAR